MRGDHSSNRYNYLTQTPIPRLITALAIPTIISMLVTGIYNTADTFFVGRISTQATAAVGLAFSVQAVIQALGFFSGHGSGNYLSRMLGAGNVSEANQMASTGFALSLIIGTTLSIVGITFIDPLSTILGATATTLEETRSYMRIILLGAPFMCGQFVINNQLRFQGSAMSAMLGLMCGAAMNIFLDPLLIFVFHMGVTGAAIATISGQITSFFVLFFSSRRGENLRLSIHHVHFNLHFLKEILNGGLPSLFRQGLAAIATVLLNTSAGRFGGDAGIAGMSIVTRVLMLLSCAVIGFGQGYQPVCSFNYGAGLVRRVRDGFFFCIKYSTLFLLIVSAICFALSSQVVSLFRDDPEVIRIGSEALRYQMLVLPFMGTIFITNMMLQSMGQGLKASITASARSGLFFIPLILILPRLFGLTGVELAQPLADIGSVLLSVPLAASELKKMKT